MAENSFLLFSKQFSSHMAYFFFILEFFVQTDFVRFLQFKNAALKTRDKSRCATIYGAPQTSVCAYNIKKSTHTHSTYTHSVASESCAFFAVCMQLKHTL